jgi:CelD/BcsL family acetyltransferase involved in cellulose biosynthesis
MTQTPAGVRTMAGAAARRGARRYVAEVADDFGKACERWRRLGRPGPTLAFQGETWLKAWYGAKCGAGVEPLPVTLVDAASGRDSLGLPLIRRRDGRLRVIEFADLGITDYNAPILGPGVAADAGADILHALRSARLNADALRFTKMPVSINGVANPLALAPGARPGRLNGNILHVPGRWEDWHWGLERTFRKELERSWRVFTRHADAAFTRIVDRSEAVRVFTDLKRLQRDRITELGLPYVLDEAANDAFYDDLLAAGLADGSAVLTALLAGSEVVAALLGIVSGGHYAMVRLATAGPAWKTCSPGRLVIERTMKMLHAEGYRAFDFTIGDYAYKRRMGVTALPLHDLDAALSWRAAPLVAASRAKAAVRANPRLLAVARRLKTLSGG